MNIGKGYLTYLMAAVAVGYGILGIVMGWMDAGTASVVIWGGLTTFGVRRAIK